VRAVIVGGGVIGLACGYELAKRSVEVTVLERGEVGGQASWGNAGWIVPTLSGPVPGPGVLSQTLSWVLKPDGPLYIRPRADPDFIRWMMLFALHCNRRSYQAGLRAMTAINRRTMELYDRWEMEGIAFEMHRAGLVFAFRSGNHLDQSLSEIESMSLPGYGRPAPLDGRTLADIEPLLSPEIAGGFVVAEERHVQPHSLCLGLAKKIEALGGSIRTGPASTGSFGTATVFALLRPRPGWSMATTSSRRPGPGPPPW